MERIFIKLLENKGRRAKKSMQSFRNQHGFRLLNSWGKLWDNGTLSSKLLTRSALKISQKPWVQLLTLPLTSCVTMAKLLNLTGSQFPHLQNEHTNSPYHLLQWIAVRWIHVKHLELCLAPSKHLRVSFYHSPGTKHFSDKHPFLPFLQSHGRMCSNKL